MVKLGFTGVYIILRISVKNIDCGYSLEPAEIWKISEFSSENFEFCVMKFSIYLNRQVFVMDSKSLDQLTFQSGASVCKYYSIY